LRKTQLQNEINEIQGLEWFHNQGYSPKKHQQTFDNLGKQNHQALILKKKQNVEIGMLTKLLK